MTRSSKAALLVALAVASGCAGAQRRGDAGYEVRLALAEHLARQGEWVSAYQAANALHREAPRDARAGLLRARALRHSGALDEAEAGLRELVAADARNAGAHAELALLCEQLRRSEEALVHHREALRLEPRSPRFLNNLGFALLVRARVREAIPLLQEGLQIDPADVRLRNNLGFALAAAGDFARAGRHFQLAGPKADARNNLGLAYERAGNLSQAYEQYLEAVQLDPRSAGARENLERVTRELARRGPTPWNVPSADQTGGS